MQLCADGLCGELLNARRSRLADPSGMSDRDWYKRREPTGRSYRDRWWLCRLKMEVMRPSYCGMSSPNRRQLNPTFGPNGAHTMDTGQRAQSYWTINSTADNADLWHRASNTETLLNQFGSDVRDTSFLIINRH